MNKLTFIEDIHKTREDLYEDTKKMDPKDEATFYNRQAEKLLKDWGIKLKRADYLLEAISRFPSENSQ